MTSSQMSLSVAVIVVQSVQKRPKKLGTLGLVRNSLVSQGISPLEALLREIGRQGRAEGTN